MRHLEGLVLCRAGAERVAVVASDVGTIEVARDDAPWAGTSFGLSGAPGAEARTLLHGALGITFDGVEVANERLTLLPVPALLASTLGGALKGFVEARESLWPVLDLPLWAESLKVAR